MRRLFLNRVRRVSSGRRDRSIAGGGGQGIVEQWKPGVLRRPIAWHARFSGKLSGPPLRDGTGKPYDPQVRLPFLPAVAAARAVESFPADQLSRGLPAVRTSNRVEEALPLELIGEREHHHCSKGDPQRPRNAGQSEGACQKAKVVRRHAAIRIAFLLRMRWYSSAHKVTGEAVPIRIPA